METDGGVMGKKGTGEGGKKGTGEGSKKEVSTTKTKNLKF